MVATHAGRKTTKAQTWTFGIAGFAAVLAVSGAGPSTCGTSSAIFIDHIQARRSGEIPPEITNLMRRAAEIIDRHTPDEFTSITTPDARLTQGWVLTSNLKWAADAIAAPHDPASSQPYLAVFHTWHTCESDGDHIYRIENTDGGWKIGAEIPETDTGGFRIRDHELSVSTDITHKSVDITDKVKFERIGEPGADYALMRLSEDYTVDRIMQGRDTGSAAVPFRQAGGEIAFLPPPDHSFTLTVHYAGTVDHADGDFLHRDEVTLSSYWYPVIARLPATATVITTAAPGFTAVAQGELVSSEQVPGGKKTTFRNSLPVSYFSLDIGRYTVTSRKVGALTLSVYLLDASSSLSKECLDTTEKALAYYELHFGSFPYSRYGIVQTHGVSEMALEAYSFATFGPHTLPNLIPHELSHTWWGGRVPCTYTRSMWNEAFADYSDDLFQRSIGRQVRQSPGEIATERRKLAHAYDAMPLGQARDTNNGTQSTIGYDKGRRVLRLLEYEIGQDAMIKCMATFVNKHIAGEAAEWSEFEAVVNRVTRSDYTWFFREWLDRVGLPNLHFENVTVRDAPGGKEILADIVQSGTPYRLSVECKVSTRKSASIVSRQEISGSQTQLKIPVDSAPSTITIDPAGIVPLAPAPDGDQDSDFTNFRF